VTDPVARLRQNYAAAFARYLFHRDEAALSAAYELGRHCLATGVGLLDVVQIHHQVVMDVLPGTEGPQERADAAATFLVEVLASFEMTHRAFRDRRGGTE
jgi:Phosphoserine phosphatase RsbU, N-terminal domain